MTGLSSESSITELLHAAADGDRDALEEVTEALYKELERLAQSKLRRQYGVGLPGATLEAGALVNETLLKVLRKTTSFANRRHFFGFANQVMTRVLLDYERRKGAAKRGGDALRITLTGLPVAEDVLSTHFVEVLEQLGQLEERKAEVVRLRVFWGMEVKEIAEILEVSMTTVERDWRFSRAWIEGELRSS